MSKLGFPLTDYETAKLSKGYIPNPPDYQYKKRAKIHSPFKTTEITFDIFEEEKSRETAPETPTEPKQFRNC